ncbi:MAG: hypothetical protein D3910_12345, partial [Candidatus Electrothrix sp. ATG2]|nr:hypothetical protein [Candidatus Electrothrix sp. ATG2]
ILDALGRTIDVARLNNVAGIERQEVENRGLISPDDIQLGAEQACLMLQLHFRDQLISTTASSRPEEMSSDLADYFPGTGTELPHRFFSEERSALAGTYVPDAKTKDTVYGIDRMMGVVIDNVTRYGTFFRWIADREALENNKLRKFIDSGKVFGQDHFEQDSTLQLVKKVLEDITEFGGLFYDRELYSFTVRKNSGGEEDSLLFSQLSAGEKHLVSLVVAIAVYLAVVFPETENPLHGEAILMIDAIELHMHPSWQREIIPKLLHSFPNCQFIITTHSPQVLGNVKPESVFLLRRDGQDVICEQPDESYGMTMDRVLEFVMDETARPNKKVQKNIENLFDHISRKEFDKAANLIKTLKEDIPTDPDVIRAEMVLHKKGLSL